MTLRRFFVGFTAIFAGALSIEVLDYHPITTLLKDRWAQTPQISGPLLLFAALLLLAWPRKGAVRLFAVCCGISMVVGLAGTAFHFASHALAPGTFGTATSWLGDPPPLAPLEFAVVGLLGLFAAAWERGGPLTPSQTRLAPLVCYGLGAFLSLAALIAGAVTAPTIATVAIGAALVFALMGYVVEVSSRTRAPGA
jgi:hypothetical protein